MPNLRIIYDNAADRAALTASTTAGTLGVANLQNNRKGRPWRATGTMARLGATWGAPERIGGVFLPFCNLSPTATMRVRVSNESAAQNQLTFSDHFMNPALWRLFDVSIIPNIATTPEGNTGAAKVVESMGNTLHELYRSFTGVAARRTTVSICVKAAGRSKVRLTQATTGFAIGAAAIFDLAMGTVSAVSHYGGMAGALATIVPLSDGWYRCAIDLVTSVDGTWYLALDLVIGTNTVSYQGDGVSGVYVTHAQVEAGSLTSYYPATVNFTGRASTGTFIGNNGLLQTAAANVARMQYNPLNLAAPPFLLLEPAATNNFTYSDGLLAQFGSGNVMAAVVPIPGFTNSIQFGDNSVTRYAYKNSTGSIGTTIGATYTISVFVMMDDGGVPFPGDTGNSAKDFAFVRENAAAASTGTVVHMGNNIYRCSYTFVATTTGGPANGIAKYLPQSARGFKVAGYQLQLGAYADSFISTGAASGTRAADIATSTLATRPAGYIDAWQSYSYDSGMLPACPAAGIRLRGLTAAQAATAYAFGGGAYARHWLPAQMPALGVAIDVSDPDNLQGYLEAGRLVVGEYWSPAHNPDYGASMTIMDSSTHYRTDSGDLRTEAGTRARKMPLQLSGLPAADRTALANIMRSNGMSGAMLVSLFPASPDLELERDHTIFGKLSSVAAISMPYCDAYSVPLEIEEI
jgi:hypothetical protein